MNPATKLAAKLTVAIVLLLGAVASADQWTFFHPESVTSFGCKIEDVTVSIKGNPSPDHSTWQAEAYAERNQEGKWSMTIAEFPHTLKGRHQAEKACSQWMDGASQRVKRAR